MSNAFAIARRDIMRMLRLPAAWVILFGLIFLPPLYAWFNIVGFWNPYGNTRGVHVAVTNEDRGANNTAMGHLELGDQIVGKLKADNTLGWRFVNRSEAMQEVYSGESYAAIIIPKDFSAQVSGITDGQQTTSGDSASHSTSVSPVRPKLEYYVNEKKNGIATKITDTGANTVDTQVNDAFNSAVSSVISSAVNSTAATMTAQRNDLVSQTVASLRTTQRDIANVRNTIAGLRGRMAAAPQQTKNARGALQAASTAGRQAGTGLQNTAKLINETQNTLNEFIGSSSSTLDQGSTLLSQASAQTNLTVSSLAGQLTQANGKIASALATARTVNDANAQLIADLKALNQESDIPGVDEVIAQLERQNTALSDSINGLSKLNTDTGTTITDTSKASNALDSSTQSTLETFGKARTGLVSGTLPGLNNSLTSLAGSSSALGAGLSGQDGVIAQANITLTQLDQAIASTSSALADTDAGLGRISTRLGALIVDLGTLNSSNLLSNLLGGSGKLDVGSIASFMLSPTVLNTQILYPVNSYGSGMAPLFTSLSLWVGAFMLIVLLKLEVDDDGLDTDTLTLGQRYWGRWMLLAAIAALQGITTAVGDLVIGVQSVNRFGFVATAAIASLVYISIAYALATTFMHIGKVLCIVLVMVQIPGSSGLYPTELLPHFFRAISPFLPFTPAVKALRETIGGFYDGHWISYMTRLLIFAAIAFLLGLVARPHLITLNRLAARQIAQSDMIVGEPIRTQGHEYRLSQAIGLLANKDEYREEIERRAVHFAKLYPRLRRGALVAGLVVPVLLALTFSLTTGTKLVALTAWIIYLLLIVIFLMAIEMIRDSLERQMQLGTLSDESVRSIVREHAAARWRGRHKSHHHDATGQRFNSRSSADTQQLPAVNEPNSRTATRNSQHDTTERRSA
ncbi:MAG: YhgE/Pip domain-containing protein [Bifidobacterium sp.]|nr:YhgE/Pip domain-containing protein [Bifidobacterium sp.]